MNVLIIDESESIRDTLGAYLTTVHKANVDRASSAKEGAAYLLSENYHLIIYDVGFDESDIQTFNNLTKSMKNVVLTTARNNYQTTEHTLLRKPFCLDELDALVVYFSKDVKYG